MPTIYSGAFKSVAAGEEHTCAVRTDGTIARWGDRHADCNRDFGCYRNQEDPDTRTSPPAGTFVDVASGYRHSCALSTSGKIACWGYDGGGRTSAPDGEYTAVAVGSEHSCGLQTDGTVTCWGNDRHGQASPPVVS